MIFSIFGKREKAARGARRAIPRRSAAVPATDPTTTTASTTAINQREIARRTAEKIDLIESQMDLAIPARVSKPDAAQQNRSGFPAARCAPAAAARRHRRRRHGACSRPPTQQGVRRTALAGAAGSALRADERPEHLGDPRRYRRAAFGGGAELGAAAGVRGSVGPLLQRPVQRGRHDPVAGDQGKPAGPAHRASVEDAVRALPGSRPPPRVRKPRHRLRVALREFAAGLERRPVAARRGRSRVNLAASTIVFPIKLDAQAVKQIEQMQRAAQRNRPAEVDFSKVDQRRRGRRGPAAARAGGFPQERPPDDAVRRGGACAARSHRSIQSGRRDPSDACWLLKLETLRFLGEQQQFEDLAIEYCVTYEVSPPSWEPMPKSIRLHNSAAATRERSAARSPSPTKPSRWKARSTAVPRPPSSPCAPTRSPTPRSSSTVAACAAWTSSVPARCSTKSPPAQRRQVPGLQGPDLPGRLPDDGHGHP